MIQRAAVCHPGSSFCWPGNRFTPLPYKHQPLQRCPPDRRNQHHGVGDDDIIISGGIDLSVGRFLP